MSDGCSLTHPGPVCSAGGGIRSAATPRTAAVPDPADVEKVARELYRQWREDSGGDPADLPDWECLNEECGDEDESDLRGAYRRRAVLILAVVRPSPDSEAVACAWCHERARGLAADGNDAMARLLASCGADGHGFDYASLGTGDREGADRG